MFARLCSTTAKTAIKGTRYFFHLKNIGKYCFIIRWNVNRNLSVTLPANVKRNMRAAVAKSYGKHLEVKSVSPVFILTLFFPTNLFIFVNVLDSHSNTWRRRGSCANLFIGCMPYWCSCYWWWLGRAASSPSHSWPRGRWCCRRCKPPTLPTRSLFCLSVIMHRSLIFNFILTGRT